MKESPRCGDCSFENVVAEVERIAYCVFVELAHIDHLKRVDLVLYEIVVNEIEDY